MRPTPRLTTLLLLAALPALACGKPEPKSEVAVATTPAVDLPPFQQEIASLNAEVTLPGVWRYGYKVVDRPDTLYGAHRAVEFLYAADTASGVPPRLLMVIRAYTRAQWDKVRESQKDLAKVLAEHGGEVYTFSIVTASPYPVGTPSTLRVDQMMMALIGERTPFKLTFKKG
ncbi:MAG: hypothetical protein H3C62_09895 [Gemmatimonadaceae bacterium]|nr:hypothetical protein [Gemmatimonadaceae bacterium]